VRHDRRPTILLVEDSSDEEMLVMRAIRQSSLPCQILVAHTTEEALAFLCAKDAFQGRESENPDVIVTDLKVSAMGGADLVSAIRTEPTTRLIPIVVFSGSANTVEIDDLYRRGANSFLEKPMDIDEFATTITRIARYWGLLNATASPAKPAAGFPYPL
jgi:two-component system response regulator